MKLFWQFPAWGVMWGMALAFYAGGKIATLAGARLGGVSVGRKMGYLFFYPGMNAEGFCAGGGGGVSRRWVHGVRYGVNGVAGAGILWGAARMVPRGYPLVAGWVGMVGLIMMLHFGILQWVGLGWRAAGYEAPALMREPVRAGSVGEFWGVRWNTAFRELAHRFIFRPAARRVGAGAAMVVTFAVSGVVHDLVISVPAGAGYGLPTVYFLMQAAGVMVERSGVGGRWLRGRAAGRVFAWVVVVLPAPLLFHSAFVMRVILPFMVVIGALPKEAVL